MSRWSAPRNARAPTGSTSDGSASRSKASNRTRSKTWPSAPTCSCSTIRTSATRWPATACSRSHRCSTPPRSPPGARRASAVRSTATTTAARRGHCRWTPPRRWPRRAKTGSTAPSPTKGGEGSRPPGARRGGWGRGGRETGLRPGGRSGGAKCSRSRGASRCACRWRGRTPRSACSAWRPRTATHRRPAGPARRLRGGAAWRGGADAALSLFSMAAAHGDAPAASEPGRLFAGEGAVAAWELLSELHALAFRGCSALNPIGILDAMARNAEAVYCPLVYGYVNYAVAGEGRQPLRFGDVPAGPGGRLGSTLGGTGLAVTRPAAVNDTLRAHLPAPLSPAPPRAL